MMPVDFPRTRAAPANHARSHRHLWIRFWEKVAVTDPSSCWEWLGATTWWGYGHVHLYTPGPRGGRKRLMLAHRLAWQLHEGKIPPGLQVMHSCDNRRCCNPDHMTLGTNKDNVDDKMRKGRHVAHRGDRNGNSRAARARRNVA